MRKKVVMISGSYFIMECGHHSPIQVTNNTNVLRAIDRFERGTLYRDCSMCAKMTKLHIEWSDFPGENDKS